MLMEPKWVLMVAGKCSVAELLSKQLSMLPNLNRVSGGVSLSADTILSGERSGKDRLGQERGESDCSGHWEPHLPSPSHHPIQARLPLQLLTRKLPVDGEAEGALPVLIQVLGAKEGGWLDGFLGA